MEYCENMFICDNLEALKILPTHHMLQVAQAPLLAQAIPMTMVSSTGSFFVYFSNNLIV